MTAGTSRPESGQILTVAELAAQEDVSAGDVLITLAYYADSGASISGEDIVEALERCQPAPSIEELQQVMTAATTGVIALARRQKALEPEVTISEQANYAHVLGKAGLMIEEANKYIRLKRYSP